VLSIAKLRPHLKMCTHTHCPHRPASNTSVQNHTHTHAHTYTHAHAHRSASNTKVRASKDGRRPSSNADPTAIGTLRESMQWGGQEEEQEDLPKARGLVRELVCLWACLSLACSCSLFDTMGGGKGRSGRICIRHGAWCVAGVSLNPFFYIHPCSSF